MSKHVVMSRLHTKVGALGVVITDEGLGLLLLPSHDYSLCHDWVRRWEPDATVVEVAHSKDDSRVRMLDEELTGYFEGDVHTFSFPLDLRGTPFQVAVWHEVCNVGYGQVRSYREIAQAVGKPAAVRAVGAANGANPVPIIVPCHRIIGSDGKLVGYGGGLNMKRRLLEVEGAMFPV
jgi:O-6-methylguanine DNA methyltransferase